MIRILVAAVLLYAALAVAMVWSQDDIIFPTHAVASPGPLPPRGERLALDTPGGEQLHGVHIPPAASFTGPRTLVLGFGGNAWNAQDAGTYLHEIYPQAHVIAFHYRGYRPSGGRPSAQALVADAPLVLAHAVEQVKPERTIAVGFSIGSAVAASLAGRSEIDGLILVTPFDSLKAVAKQLYPWLPVGLVFQHELNSAEFLGDSDVPVAIIAAERDEIIPARRTEALRPAVAKLVYDRTVQRAGHNDLYSRPEFHAAMREAAEAIHVSAPAGQKD
jgi:pimeloyl-ACP methyl ester carboxylesterase